MSQLPVLTTLLCLAAPLLSHGADVRWKATRTLSAPEAIQAAAANERFVFAINSRLIAKYDRKTGKRLAVSQGKATHLNSGFLFKGRLLCAHSNYPKLPERSSVMALDITSMQLSVFKDFKDFGGSLTWVLRREDHWWCNFARYGKDNGKTFLVKFDDQWREKQRWTYPPVVVGQLDRYSLSGGVWLGEELLVTGHHDPVAFRMRVPARGKVLEFIEKQAVPFSGQGIATDGKSGDLVGIHRARRQLIFASRQ